MEKIDYNKLIDPLCIPIIKHLREEKQIETLFCCQGRNKEDKPEREAQAHSLRGYITARRNEESINLLLKLYELEMTRWPMTGKQAKKAKFEINPQQDTVTFWMPARIWESREKLEQEWNILLEESKKL